MATWEKSTRPPTTLMGPTRRKSATKKSWSSRWVWLQKCIIYNINSEEWVRWQSWIFLFKKLPVFLLPQSTISHTHLTLSRVKLVRISSSEIKLQSATKLFSFPFKHAQSNCSKYVLSSQLPSNCTNKHKVKTLLKWGQRRRPFLACTFLRFSFWAGA